MVRRVLFHELLLNVLGFGTEPSVKRSPVYRLILVKHSPVSQAQPPLVPVSRQFCDRDLFAKEVFAVIIQAVCKRAMTMKVNGGLTCTVLEECRQRTFVIPSIVVDGFELKVANHVSRCKRAAQTVSVRRVGRGAMPAQVPIHKKAFVFVVGQQGRSVSGTISSNI